MSDDQLAKIIAAAFEEREGVSPATKGPVREAVDAALDWSTAAMRASEPNEVVAPIHPKASP